MIIRNPRTLATGVVYLGLGGGFAATTAGYRIGTSAAMGPGFFPFRVGAILAAPGAGLVVQALRPGPGSEPAPRLHLRALIPVLLAVLAFPLALRPLGLPVTVAICTTIAAAADPALRRREVAVLALGAVLIFRIGLNLPLPLWPSALAGLTN